MTILRYDLGLEGAFSAYKILAGLFYDSKNDVAATVMTVDDFKYDMLLQLQRKSNTKVSPSSGHV